MEPRVRRRQNQAITFSQSFLLDTDHPNSVKHLFDLPDSFGEYHCAVAARRLYMNGRAETTDSEIQLTQGWLQVFRLPVDV